MISISPKQFSSLCRIGVPISALALCILLGLGIYEGLFISPPDYQQGDAVRIMYVHVPAAWMALGIYVAMAVANILGFVWKHPLSHLSSVVMAPIGAMFALLCLITGSIWGKPIWGTWWVFDARLTSMLILFFFYVGYIALYHAYTDIAKGEKMAGYLSILGVVNVPIVKFSVDWWNTLHQPASIIRSQGMSIAHEMLTPLFLMFGAYLSYFLLVFFLGCLSEMRSRRFQRRRLSEF